ncbi:hypothetical protein FOC1_g10014503 [Fusarium oxysporum f. sp. cubense race 1]|uniref:Uncharacterized protein n=1 Tax=Fusarium oxysporum f. sp. cubense (strain race 1) TaxID=1229664 RepID=N4UBF9_FUSC1|nr:hypothetical protein FOC1_g10014503 [Fusarium oxysporum f. sp. cubense race 1]
MALPHSTHGGHAQKRAVNECELVGSLCEKWRRSKADKRRLETLNRCEWIGPR